MMFINRHAIWCFALLSGISCTLNGYANQKPLSYPTDSRIKMVTYRDNDVIPIKGKTFTATQLIFAKDEYILDTEGGDTQGWIVHAPDNDSLGHMLFIKPTILDSNTNLTVVTNKHSYYFRLRSNHSLNDSGDITYAVKFVYPEEESRRAKHLKSIQKKRRDSMLNSGKDPKSYNWRYSFAGNRAIMPLHIFDDGTFTFFELRPHQPVPAVFAVDDKSGKESLVNTRVQGRYLVVQRTAPQFTLRNGNQVTSIFNKNGIRQAKAGI